MKTERAGSLALFWSLGISANRITIFAAAGIAFLIASGDVAVSFQVLPAGIDTVARSILGQLHSGVDDLTAAISLTSLVATTCLAFVIVQILRRRHGNVVHETHPAEPAQ